MLLSLFCVPCETNTKEFVVEKVEKGLYVRVDYKGTLQNGETFDTSEGGQPFEVHMGAGQLIHGFERELVGMSVNEKKVFTLAPEDAYGVRKEDLVRDLPRADIPPELDLQVGMTIGLQTPEGQQIPAQITHMDDEKVSLDMNHPLVGKSLTFEVEVVAISNTPTQAPAAGCGQGCSCSSDDH
jgi:peptidylprolyl isomerase